MHLLQRQYPYLKLLRILFLQSFLQVRALLIWVLTADLLSCYPLNLKEEQDSEQVYFHIYLYL